MSDSPREAPSIPAPAHASTGGLHVPGSLEFPSRFASAMLGVWLLVLLLAPPANNTFWGVNGLRSIAPALVAALVLSASLAALLAWRSPDGPLARLASSMVIAVAVCFPLREALHHLGDTSSRQGAVLSFVRGTYAQPLSEWARQLHAQPLDLGLNLLLTSRVLVSTGSMAIAVSTTSLLLLLIACAAAWAIAQQLDGRRRTAWALWFMLVCTGGLQAYAGYAESAGIVAASLLVCAVVMLAPISNTRAAIVLGGAWLLAYMSHRTGLLLIPVLALRLLGPSIAGDDARARRTAALVILALVVVAITLALLAGAQGQLVADASEVLRWPDPDTLASVPSDLLNLLLVIAPLAFAAPLLAGRRAIAAFDRDPRSRVLLLAALLYSPLAFPVPVAASGLGIHRDWDLAVGLGVWLTLAGALLLSHLDAARMRGAAVAVLPVLVLGAGGWVAVHADTAASLRRVEALANGTPSLGVAQRSAVFHFYGNRAAGIGDTRLAANLLQSSWQMVPSPSRGVQAINAWLRADEPDSARAMLSAMRARGGLPPSLVARLDSLEWQLRSMERR